MGWIVGGTTTTMKGEASHENQHDQPCPSPASHCSQGGLWVLTMGQEGDGAGSTMDQDYDGHIPTPSPAFVWGQGFFIQLVLLAALCILPGGSFF